MERAAGVSMRLFFATILMALGASNAAIASSFVVLDGIDTPTSPSIIVLGDSPPSIVAANAPDISSLHPSIQRFGGLPPEERKFITVSPSVIAMVDAPQPVAFENVASIGDERAKRRLRGTLPLVIRGGIVGDAYSSAPVAPSSGDSAPSQPEQQVSAPSSAPDKPDPAPKQPGTPEDDRMPKSALPPPAPPTGRME
ncbi:MAG: hypothetical protein WDZ83_04540 [Rhizobiaceae bacterium]